LVFLAAGAAEAQLPSPRIARLVPAGAQRGGVVELTLQGDHLEEVRSLRASHPSIRAAHKDGLTFRVEIAADAPLGIHQFWASGQWGASFPVSFAVDDLAQAAETEPNDAPAAAQAIALESVVGGAIQSAADRDFFKLALKAGQRVFADCFAYRIDSNLDPTLEVFDPSGKSIAYNRDFQGEEAFVDFAAAADGDHTIVVHDFTYRGGADRHYRLQVSSRPRIDFIVPAAVPAGTTKEVKAFGRALPGGAPAGHHWIDGRPLESIEVAVTAPQTPGPLFGRFGGDRAPQGAKVDLFEFRHSTPAGATNAVPLGIAAGAVQVESEPNDEPEKPQKIEIPVDLTGQLAAEGDLDWFEFEAKKGEPLLLEAIAARMGSAADLVLTLTKADDASSFLQEADDDGEALASKRFDTRGVDPVLRWSAPDDGRYRVLVRDIAPGRAGLGRFYRLAVRRDEPGYRIYLLAGGQQAPEALTLCRGASEYFEVYALRRGGYEGTIRVEASRLPLGVECPPAHLGPKSVFAPLVFTAEPGAPVDAASIGIAAAGWFAGERVDRPGLGYVLDRAANDENTLANLVRPLRDLPVAVIDTPAPFSLVASPARIAIRPGEKPALKLKLQRQPPFEGDVNITPLSGAQGLKVPNGKIEKGKDELNIELTLDGSPAPGRTTIALLGEADVPFAKNPKDKKNNLKVRCPSTPVTIDIVTLPFELKLADLHGGKVNPGGTVALDVTIARKHGFDGAVTLSLVLPEAVKDLQAPDVKLGRGTAAGSLTVKAVEGAAAAPGPRADLILRATAEIFGTPVSADVKFSLEVEPKK